MTDVRLKPNGNRLVIGNCHEFNTQRQALLKESGPKSVLIDMSEIEFMDSSGLGALVGIRKAAGKNGSVTLVNPSEFVCRIIDSTKMKSIFNFQTE